MGNFRWSGVFAVFAVSILSACSSTPELGGGTGNVVAGSAGGGSKEGANSALESCDSPLGTLAVTEDQGVLYSLSQNQLGSTVPVIRLMIQQSNCFVVVERGRAMNNMMQERKLQQSGEMRSGSNYGKGQMVAADYTVSPRVTFSAKGTSGIGSAIGGFFGAIAAGFKSNEASTTLLLIDNRSGVQIAAAMGSAQNFDFAGGLGAFGSGFGAIAGGYSNTPQGKVVVASFADSYNNMVKALRNYKAQNVKGGLGKGGNLSVQGD